MSNENFIVEEAKKLKEELWKEFMARVEADDRLPKGTKTVSFIGSVEKYKKLFMAD